MDVLDHTLQLTAQDWGTVATFDWISAPKPKSNPGFPVIEVTQEKSQDAVLRFRGKDVTVLNFASGVSPGGGVRYGAKAQEEDLCLCSGLLHGLETLPKYYLANQAKKAPEDCYDIMIESEQVPFVKDGDRIHVDIAKRLLEVQVDEGELAKRRKAWKRPKPRIDHGYLARYARTVTSASTGAICK